MILKMTCGQVCMNFTCSPTSNIGILHSKMVVSTTLTIIIAQLYAQSLSVYFSKIFTIKTADLPDAARRFALTLRIRSVAGLSLRSVESGSSAFCKQESLWPMIKVCLKYLCYQSC